MFYVTFRYLLKLQSEELQIHAAEITDVRKAVEREKLSKELLLKHTLPNKKKSNRNARKVHQPNDLPHVAIKEEPEDVTDYNSLSSNATDIAGYATTENSLIGDVNVTQKNEYLNQDEELMVQHKSTLSEVKQLRTKIAESLGDYDEMKRNIDELKTEVS